MVLQVTIYRVADGMSLTGTTDIDRRPEVKYCQKYLKLVSRKLRTMPDRCVMHLDGFEVYFITAGSLTVLALCEETYPAVLAFCFMEETQREFMAKYDLSKINMVKRPYELIEFELYLQKSKQRYLNTRSLTTKLNLTDMSTELRLRPPYIVQEADLGVVDNTIFKSFKDSYRPTASYAKRKKHVHKHAKVTPGRRLLPVTWIGMISIFLNLLCMALNLTRGMTIVNHGHYDEEDQGAYTFGAVFMTAGLTCIYQVYLIFYYCRWRKLKTFVSLSLIIGCSYYLEQFRNTYQISFHVGTATFSSIVILRRQLTEKLPGYSV